MSASAHEPSASLLELELVRVALTDPDLQLCPRPVDLDWSYSGILPRSMVGYRPEAGVIYYGASSSLAQWLTSQRGNPRRLNQGDRLIRELLFCVHDYLHILAYRVIQQSQPDLELGAGPITAATIETYVFLHLLTETVATVGLDYWYLCTFDLDSRIRIGTDLRSLTVSYRLEDENEHRRFAENFTAQYPEFLTTLCEFYCTGEFLGFEIEDLPWQRALMAQLGSDLWRLVRDETRPVRGINSYLAPWASPIGAPPTFASSTPRAST